jgi:hypothetical protein
MIKARHRSDARPTQFVDDISHIVGTNQNVAAGRDHNLVPGCPRHIGKVRDLAIGTMFSRIDFQSGGFFGKRAAKLVYGLDSRI